MFAPDQNKNNVFVTLCIGIMYSFCLDAANMCCLSFLEVLITCLMIENVFEKINGGVIILAMNVQIAFTFNL